MSKIIEQLMEVAEVFCRRGVRGRPRANALKLARRDMNESLAPILAAIQKRIAAGHSHNCDAVIFEDGEIIVASKSGCTCGHDELVAALALMTAEQEMKK